MTDELFIGAHLQQRLIETKSPHSKRKRTMGLRLVGFIVAKDW